MKIFHATLTSFAVFALAGGSDSTRTNELSQYGEVSVQLISYDRAHHDAAQSRGQQAVDSLLLQQHIREAGLRFYLRCMG